MKSLLRTLTTLALCTSLHVNGGAAQNCYYPNGDLAQGDGACSSNGGACCPYQWECLSNGLCYLENAGFYGRYTCTDQTWQSSGCPQICTESNTASGNEAVLQCGDGSWCCDGDRSFNCCTTANTEYFALPQGNSIAYISSVPSATSVASPASPNSAAPTSDATPTSPTSQASSSSPSSTSASTTPSSSASSTGASLSSTTSSQNGQTSSNPQSSSTMELASTITSEAVTTGTDGAVSTVVILSTVSMSMPVTAASNHNSSSSSSNLGLIIGLAVGIPVALLACAILACLLWKRRKAKHQSIASHNPSLNDDKYGHQVGHVAPDAHAPELDSYPVALNRTKSGRTSELYGSTMHSPAMSTGTGPPQYSQYSPRSPRLQSVEEGQQEPAELWGGYVPYRPPRTELPSEQQG